LGLDPTSGLFAGEGHIPLACTPTPPSAAPVTGYTDKCETTFDFAMTITRVHEDPRVTKPYSEEQWARIEQLGAAVDEKLVAGDVRLTMGGEPTFVSIDDMDGAEWTIAASGPTKRKLAGRLLKKAAHPLCLRWLPALQPGQMVSGRIAAALGAVLLLAHDGLPLWHDPRWIADDETPQGYGPEQAQAFADGVDPASGRDARFGSSPATRTAITTCGKSAPCRSTSIR
jgi:hypothetical protein